MGGSKSSSSSKPVDMTPEEFKKLQGPFGDVLMNLIGQYIPDGSKAIMQGYQGPTTTGLGKTEKSALNNVNAIANKPNPYQVTNPGAAMNAGKGGAYAQAKPMPRDPRLDKLYNNIGSGMPQNPAVMSGTDKAFLQGIQNSGKNPGSVNAFTDALGIKSKTPLSGFADQLSKASNTGAFGGDNKFSDAYIDQAQRRTMENLTETLDRTLPGRFTQAGQIVSPRGSSAFDRAAAIASRGATQEMGDIATRINYQALESARGREADALGAELGRRGEENARYAQAQQAQLDRAMQIPGMTAQLNNLNAQTNNTYANMGQTQANTALTMANSLGQEAQTNYIQGAQTNNTNAQTGLLNAQTGTQNAQTGMIGSQVKSQEVDTAIKNLQAQALPRLIQDMGVERGMEAFNNQVNSLLAVLGIGAGVTRPVVSQESNSKSGSFSLK